MRRRGLLAPQTGPPTAMILASSHRLLSQSAWYFLIAAALFAIGILGRWSRSRSPDKGSTVLTPPGFVLYLGPLICAGSLVAMLVALVSRT